MASKVALLKRRTPDAAPPATRCPAIDIRRPLAWALRPPALIDVRDRRARWAG